MKISNYRQALEFLEGNLPRSDAQVFRGQAGLKRAKNFLQILGNPQNKLKVIHIAGTSGKGSTAMMLSQLLAAHDFKVGMALSPHVYDIRERCQLNNKLIDKKEFVAALNAVMPAITKMQSARESPSYFEVLLALSLVVFTKQQVDYVILETGLGGLLDASNTVERKDKLCMLTSIGFDHTEVLGKTPSEIAVQKAGIIQTGNHVIALKQDVAVNQVFKAAVQAKQASLEWVEPSARDIFVNRQELFRINDQLWGQHQSQNASLALAAIKNLAARDKWRLRADRVQAAFRRLILPGRFEQVKAKKKIFILDGAHNQQKLDALFKAVNDKFNSKPFGLLLTMRQSKSIPALPEVSQVITTQFKIDHQDMDITAFEPIALAHKLQNVNPQLNIQPVANTTDAVKHMFTSSISLWLVTGSFFILAEAKAAINKLK